MIYVDYLKNISCFSLLERLPHTVRGFCADKQTGLDIFYNYVK